MAKQRRRPRQRTAQETNVKDLKVKSYDEKSSSKLPHNDPDWYIYDKEMFDGVISMPTLEFKGKNIPWNSNRKDTGTGNPVMDKFAKVSDVPLATPTVAAYLMNPGLEYCPQAHALRPNKYTAINVAARKMYAELSASNAKTSLYAPQDIATLILGLGQIIAMITHLKRMYGIANHFNFYSRRVPADLFAAMHLNNYQTLSQNLANFRNEVNRLIARVDTIQFPTGLSYFKKCEYIYQNVFVDRDEKMVTYHLMAPFSTWLIDEASYSEGTILKTVECTDKRYDQILSIVGNMIEAILTSSTFNTIFADIINLSNRNVLNTDSLHIDMLPIDYAIEPIYSEQFNWQVMNMSILPFPNDTSLTTINTPLNDVYPDADTNMLIYAPRYQPGTGEDSVYGTSVWSKVPPIRLPDTNPSQDLFVELLAYAAMPRVNTVNNTQNVPSSAVYLEDLPDYWCSLARIVRPSDTTSINSVVRNIYSNGLGKYDWYTIAESSQFVHFPFLALYDLDPTSEEVWVLPITRLSAYTQVSKNALSNLRYQTYLGLFSFKR